MTRPDVQIAFDRLISDGGDIIAGGGLMFWNDPGVKLL